MPTEKPKTEKITWAALTTRAAAHNYTLEKDGEQWYATIGGTRYGPMQTLQELDEFLPAEEK